MSGSTVEEGISTVVHATVQELFDMLGTGEVRVCIPL